MKSLLNDLDGIYTKAINGELDINEAFDIIDNHYCSLDKNILKNKLKG